MANLLHGVPKHELNAILEATTLVPKDRIDIHLRKVTHKPFAAREVLRTGRVAVETDHMHAGRAPRRDSGGGVLHHHAFAGIDVEHLGGLEETVGRRLATPVVLGAQHELDETADSAEIDRRRNIGVRRSRNHDARSNLRDLLQERNGSRDNQLRRIRRQTIVVGTQNLRVFDGGRGPELGELGVDRRMDVEPAMTDDDGGKGTDRRRLAAVRLPGDDRLGPQHLRVDERAIQGDEEGRWTH